jgi:hypothetical protein
VNRTAYLATIDHEGDGLFLTRQEKGMNSGIRELHDVVRGTGGQFDNKIAPTPTPTAPQQTAFMDVIATIMKRDRDTVSAIIKSMSS